LESIPRLNDQSFLSALRRQVKGNRSRYRAFYSTFLEGLTTEPHHMVVPVDDHMVHRGDAVFEAIKFVRHGVYALDRHLDRLDVSRNNIGLSLPFSRDHLENAIFETIRASGLETGIVRLYLARGPGGFTANPYEASGSQIYCAITELSSLQVEKYDVGVKVGVSKVQVKEGFLARTKTCNYLPNVLMKKESVDRALDFTVSRDEKGKIAESSTENFVIIDSKGCLVIPKFDRILKGVTMIRVAELARGQGLKVLQKSFTKDDVRKAKGAMMLGTTIDVVPVQTFETKKWRDPLLKAPEIKQIMDAFQYDLKRGPLLRRY
jgi:branched-subunit amino acid aminotransferase/4-amino-4-deoxychorismate lyase